MADQEGVPPRRGGEDPEIVDGGAPAGPPRYGWFGGVLEGRVGDPAALRKAYGALERRTAVPCDLDVDGGRFSLMFAEDTVAGEHLSVERQDELLEGLGAVLAASADPAAAESTLRGSLVFGDRVIETLFAVVDGRLDPVSRQRDLSPRDPSGPAGRTQDASLGGLDAPFRDVARGRGLMLAALILVAGGLAAWRSGYLGLAYDTLAAPAADEVEVSTGLFGETLTLELDRAMASYACEVRRGPAYPATPADAEALTASAATTGERAAMNAVADGTRVWVRVVDAAGEVLAAEELDLRPLLTEEDAPIEAKLRARAGGVRVELSLSSGLESGGRKGAKDDR